MLAFEKGTSNKEVADRLGIPKNTLSTWKKNKDNIIQAYCSGHVAKSVQPEIYELINNCLLKCFTTKRSENVPISYPLNIQASVGWLEELEETLCLYSIYFC